MSKLAHSDSEHMLIIELQRNPKETAAHIMAQAAKIDKLEKGFKAIQSMYEEEINDLYSEYGSYDGATGETEFGSMEDHRCDLEERKEKLDIIIKSVLDDT